MIQLSTRHTFGLSSCAQSEVVLSSLEQVVAWCKQPRDDFYILGGGSNSIFVEDYPGCIVQVALRGIELTEREDSWQLRVAAGENWHQLVAWSIEQGINGLENLALIPGTVGAAPIQNIGAYGREVADFIETVDAVEIGSGKPLQFSNQACQFGYRDSVFKQQWANRCLITAVTFELPKQWQAQINYAGLDTLDKPDAATIFAEVIRVRQQKLPDPAVQGNAGSFFKNPVVAAQVFNTLQHDFVSIPHYVQADGQIKIPAAWLIDQCGFKGQTRGGVICHPNQPLVLANNGSAKGDDVVAFAREIRDTVWNRFAIRLENEVRLVGRHGLITL